jgi:hypothetical protein
MWSAVLAEVDSQVIAGASSEPEVDLWQNKGRMARPKFPGVVKWPLVTRLLGLPHRGR